MVMGLGFLVLKLHIFIIVSLAHESAGLVLQSTEISKPHKLGYVLQSIHGMIPSMPPTPSKVDISHIPTPPPQVLQDFVPSMPPNPPKVLPSRNPAPSIQVIQGFTPSMLPSPSKVMPSHKPAPPPQVIQGLVPSRLPLPPEVTSHTPAPPPEVSQGSLPPMQPLPPKVVPSHKPVLPPPQAKQGFESSVPANPPKISRSHEPTHQHQVIQGRVPSMPPNPPEIMPLHKPAPHPQVIHGLRPSMPPRPANIMPSIKQAPLPPIFEGVVPSMPPNSPKIMPTHKLAPQSQVILGPEPSKPPTDPFNRRLPGTPTASPQTKFPRKKPVMDPSVPAVAPTMISEPAVSPISALPPTRTRYRLPIAAPPLLKHFASRNHSPANGSFPIVASAPSKATAPSNNNTSAPPESSPNPAERRWRHSPASLPVHSSYKYHHAKKNASHPALAPPVSLPPAGPDQQGPIAPPDSSNSPIILPKQQRHRQQHPPPMNQAPSVSPVKPPFVPAVREGSPVHSPAPSLQNTLPGIPPTRSPSGTFQKKPKPQLPSPAQSLPPPPPNQDCTSLTCIEPLTNSPPGSPCGCVWPMQVGLRLGVALYTFFPLVSTLAEEIATGVFMKLSQVRIMGANAAGQQLEKTVVLIDLVPLGEKFDNTSALLAYEKFWHKQVFINPSFFGDYEVLYVQYPGLPPSPPFAPSSITSDGQYPGHGNNGRTIQPLGVDVRKKRNRELGGTMIAIIILSSCIAVALCIGSAWLLLLKCRNRSRRIPTPTPQCLASALAKPSGSMMFGSGHSSVSMSFGSSITAHTGSARTFTASEIEKATDRFDASRILGEGGFGRVYRGILDDGAQVAMKVLKRDDQQGGREFLAEVEMLSRLHHRNLVKLIGICIEDNARCLVYELIPNGSVESHLHGLDKETAPLDWGARMKIALGAARGLAYLHEDSSPHVIHRDFKSSNILLEHDFTPKVSDFGLARTALDEGNQHITTRVMGTFGYVAPEYAMTGHLLVKSDVYSYGVVLLELLTGRKPVDMTQPQGQENLVSWARPFLTSKEGLEMIIDPALGSDVTFDSVAKVAAIASMCVQPEVTHRPFMGEVVQALKLVCNECDETKEAGSESCGQEDYSVVDVDTRTSTDSGQLPESSRGHYAMPDYNSSIDVDRGLSASDVFSTSAMFGRLSSDSFRRHSSSGPLTTGRSKQFWQRIGLSRGSISEHGVAFRL